MMSNIKASEVSPDLAVSSVAKPERMLAGFPWVSAIVLYTLSWGWSLLRPNTLYWDDWAFFWRKSFISTSKVLHSMGYPPWTGIVEFALLNAGAWAVRVETYFVFFGAGIFLHILITSFPKLTLVTRQKIVLLFLIVPVNHARISMIENDDATSYFLFFLAWMLLICFSNWKSFVLSIVLFFLSFKTPSILFFMPLPLLQLFILKKREILKVKSFSRVHFKIFTIGIVPVLYVILRKIFWFPPENMRDYQHITYEGLRVGLLPLLVGLLCLLFVTVRKRETGLTGIGVNMLIYGFLITCLALFPYFAGEFYVGYKGRPAYITVFEFRADWRSRYQLLMPLGLALSVVGLNELLNWKKKNLILSVVLVVSVGLNMFWGSQYFLQSLKQEKMVELLKETKNKVVIASLGDQTIRFNGRENTFRSYEWDGFMILAGIATDRPGCEALPNGSVLVLKSDKPYLSALISRDLGLYFDVTPCTELLAKDS